MYYSKQLSSIFYKVYPTVSEIDTSRVKNDPGGYYEDHKKDIHRELGPAKHDPLQEASFAFAMAAQAGAVTELDDNFRYVVLERINCNDPIVSTNVIGGYGGTILESTPDNRQELCNEKALNQMIAQANKHIQLGNNRQDGLLTHLSIDEKLVENVLYTISIISLYSPRIVKNNSGCMDFLDQALPDNSIESTYAGLAYANIARQDPESLSEELDKFINGINQSYISGGIQNNGLRSTHYELNDRFFAAMAYCLYKTVPEIDTDEYRKIKLIKNVVDQLAHFASIDGTKSRHRAIALHALIPICERWEDQLDAKTREDIVELVELCVKRTDTHPSVVAAAYRLQDVLSETENDLLERIADIFKPIVDKQDSGKATIMEAIEQFNSEFNININYNFRDIHGDQQIIDTDNVKNMLHNSPNSSLQDLS
jgi:hypothetical protein